MTAVTTMISASTSVFFAGGARPRALHGSPTTAPEQAPRSPPLALTPASARRADPTPTPLSVTSISEGLFLEKIHATRGGADSAGGLGPNGSTDSLKEDSMARKLTGLGQSLREAGASVVRRTSRDLDAPARPGVGRGRFVLQGLVGRWGSGASEAVARPPASGREHGVAGPSSCLAALATRHPRPSLSRPALLAQVRLRSA